MSEIISKDNKDNIEETNFWEMVKEGESIVIPVFQRDYAQGRESVKEILEGFLDDIFDHLFNGERLKLSFVYGTTEIINNRKMYIPYDGQQRLTLLYILFLYFAAYNQEWDDIKILSKFHYYTRDYANEFCDFLTFFDDNTSRSNIFQRIDLNEDIREQIRLDISYIDSWTFDPTVESMLIVIEEIRKEFFRRTDALNQTEKDETARELLTRLKSKIIFFDWCTIESSENIYIKMNGRGKPLSAFDNFKNSLFAELKRFRQQDEEKGIKERIEFLQDFEAKMESVWTSLFWGNRESLSETKTHNIAPFMMNFLFYVFELRNTIKNNETGKRFYFGYKQYFSWIDEKNVIKFITAFHKKCRAFEVSIEDYIWLSKLLDALCAKIKEDEKLKECFINVIKNRENKDYVEAAMYFEYIVKASVYSSDGTYEYTEYKYAGDWKKLISRIMNTVKTYRSHSEALIRDKHIFYGYHCIFIETVFSNNKEGNLIEASDLFDEAAKDKLKENFDASHAYNQLEEELFKMSLLKNKGDIWEDRIKNAEDELEYFDNQIYFLFKLSMRDGNCVDEELFDKYLAVTKELIDKKGIKKKYENKFTGILLSIDDYRILCEEDYGSALSLCSNEADKYYSWRYLFDTMELPDENKTLKILKKAFDIIIENEVNINNAYNQIKNKTLDKKWKEIIIKYPKIFQYSNKYRIVFQDNSSQHYLVNSNASKRVRRDGLDRSVNIELYGMCRDAGYKDDDMTIDGQRIYLPNNIEITNVREKNYYQLDGKNYKADQYDKIVEVLKQKRKRIRNE